MGCCCCCCWFVVSNPENNSVDPVEPVGNYEKGFAVNLSFFSKDWIDIPSFLYSRSRLEIVHLRLLTVRRVFAPAANGESQRIGKLSSETPTMHRDTVNESTSRQDQHGVALPDYWSKTVHRDTLMESIFLFHTLPVKTKRSLLFCHQFVSNDLTWTLFEPRNSFSSLTIRSKCVNSRIRFSSRCNSIRLVWKKKDVSVITRILFLSKTSSRRLRKASKPSTLEISLPRERDQ